MIKVKQIIPSDSVAVSSGVTLGGQVAEVVAWPLNPDGDPLTLVASIDCSKIKGDTKKVAFQVKACCTFFLLTASQTIFSRI
jgi:hypothetical protein